MAKDQLLVLTTPPRRRDSGDSLNMQRRKKRLAKFSKVATDVFFGEIKKILDFDSLVDPPANQPCWRKKVKSSSSDTQTSHHQIRLLR